MTNEVIYVDNMMSKVCIYDITRLKHDGMRLATVVVVSNLPKNHFKLTI